MKAITLWQPYATLVALGVKTIETRSWSTDYRGDLLIHAARRWDRDTADTCRLAGGVIRYEGLGALPWRETIGRAVAVARLVGVERVPWTGWSPGREAPALDFEWGDLSPGRYAWRLDRVRAVLPPIAWRGAQGLWTVPDELKALVCEATSPAATPGEG